MICSGDVGGVMEYILVVILCGDVIIIVSCWRKKWQKRKLLMLEAKQ